MPRVPSRYTQADIARALRAAKQVGGFRVEILLDEGRIILLKDSGDPDPPYLRHDEQEPVL